jgi:class II lanthipeptide synthase
MCRSQEVLARILEGYDLSGGADVISGKAGAIPALLILASMLRDRSLESFATRLGDELVQSAEQLAVSCSWRSAGEAFQPNLTGFAHGAAGVSTALLELFRAVGGATYRNTAIGGFDYERTWFNSDIGNWADLRGMRLNKRIRRSRVRFGNAWCHGAPGIALSRLRAYEILGDLKCKEEARAGT